MTSSSGAAPGRLAARNLALRPVPRETVQDQVYRQLRELILNGGIEPGRTVTIQSLSEAFGVSAMPVREALHRLVAEKALTVVAGRSVGIPPLSIERLKDLKRVRVEIEGVATEWAAVSITAADLDRLGALIAEMDAAIAERDGRRYVPANREFHFTIYRAAGSESLLSIIESLWLRIGPYFDLLNATGNWRASNVEHRAMHEALLRGDGAAARAAMRADIEGAAQALVGILGGQET
ncbi:GntR family transcriptional regulator [Skermanella mucosa]|uniref:GntR family transcriptional regulator n=1 Tax=Skermanella mucosa TaxID=1789672 RepID=UPI00192AE79C|nr:GntR family transcriptional regulator [Skermanella mucosa]UEM19185.1 GntR family transcriptional regulator [Skermanella mucosa]